MILFWVLFYCFLVFYIKNNVCIFYIISRFISPADGVQPVCRFRLFCLYKGYGFVVEFTEHGYVAVDVRFHHVDSGKRNRLKARKSTPSLLRKILCVGNKKAKDLFLNLRF